MFSPSARRILLAVLTLFVLVQGYFMFFAPDGGWLTKHGLLGAIPAYVLLSTRDPILFAGMIDFMVMSTLVETWMLSQLPRHTRYRPRTLLWLLTFAAYPCLGVLVYFLWLHPKAHTPAQPVPAAADHPTLSIDTFRPKQTP
jgi:hypothetical protein